MNFIRLLKTKIVLLPIPLRTFVLTIILVPYMFYLGVPVISVWLKKWVEK
jgi:antibiotic biosynthesis monooxygenase (ABM) superfamily enzyme